MNSFPLECDAFVHRASYTGTDGGHMTLVFWPPPPPPPPPSGRWSFGVIVLAALAVTSSGTMPRRIHASSATACGLPGAQCLRDTKGTALIGLGPGFAELFPAPETDPGRGGSYDFKRSPCSSTSLPCRPIEDLAARYAENGKR